MVREKEADVSPAHAEGRQLENDASVQITVSQRTLRSVLLWALALLIFAGFCAEIANALLELHETSEIVAFFGLSYEHNLPTWFSTCLLFACAVVLALIAAGARREQDPFTRHWSVLAITFLYLSVDELVSIHEVASSWFNTGGVLYFGWVIPAAVFVTLFGLSYLRFLGRLPRNLRNRFILAGSVYVGGALLMELPLGYWTERMGNDNLVYGMLDLVEESMEMIGASLFLESLVGHLAHLRGRCIGAEGDIWYRLASELRVSGEPQARPLS